MIDLPIIENVTEHLYAKDRLEVRPTQGVKIAPTIIQNFDGKIKVLHGGDGKIIETPQDGIDDAVRFANSLDIGIVKLCHGHTPKKNGEET